MDMWRATYPFTGDIFIFRSRRMDRLKILIWDGSGLCLVSKRLENGASAWPPVRDGAVTLTAAQLHLLFTGMQWANIAGAAQEAVVSIGQNSW
jgi:transposase